MHSMHAHLDAPLLAPHIQNPAKRFHCVFENQLHLSTQYAPSYTFTVFMRLTCCGAYMCAKKAVALAAILCLYQEQSSLLSYSPVMPKVPKA